MAEHVFETISSEILHTGKIFALRKDQVLMPGGKVVNREVVEHYGAVGVVALDEDDNIPMVYQYRHPFGRRLWELPAGLLDIHGEPPHLTAARELREEAGLEAKTWQVLVDLDSTPGFSDESVRVYLATGLTDVGRPKGHDEEADMTLHWYPLAEAVRRVFSGKSSMPLPCPGFWRHPQSATASRSPGRWTRRGSIDRQRSLRDRLGNDHAGAACGDAGAGLPRPSDDRAGVAANTLSSYRRDLRRYCEHLAVRGIDDLAKVSEDDVSEFLVALRRGDPEAGRRRCRRCRRRGLDRGARPAPVRRRRRTDRRGCGPRGQTTDPGRRLPKSLTIDEVLALLAAAGGDSPSDGPLTLRNRALLEFLYSTGSRISEAVGLDVDDVDMHARSVLLRGKGGKQRLVPVGRPAVEALKAYLVRGRPELARRAAEHQACSSTRAVGGCRGKVRGKSCRTPPNAPASPPMCRHTRCGIRLRPTCSTGALTFGWCRSCSGMPR
ncbi:phage integrase family protein [Mycobacterium xenopi 4042]|uniref:Phage integrase family protein n=1 Tax=Mycobacterium xenopi 4042 TaxID=1299334 RepID=X8BIB5_MYCXE|nr:phage integrase family protein [Mycobacterium xenopi 4042]